MSAPVCAGCGNDGTKGALYIAVDARWNIERGAWVLQEREDAGGGYIDCLECDHHTPNPSFPYGLEVKP